MASKRCPKCGLLNRATAERCDCGRSFVDGSQGKTLDDRLASRSPANADELRQTRDAAVRKARNWILGVGIAMFVFDQFMIQIWYGESIPADWRLKLLLLDAVLLVIFVAMYIMARTKPLAACIVALCVFWALHLVLAVFDPTSLFNGIIVKILFTIALVNGIRSARRAELLQKELAEIFS
jgi:hypothetical protein